MPTAPKATAKKATARPAPNAPPSGASKKVAKPPPAKAVAKKALPKRETPASAPPEPAKLVSLEDQEDKLRLLYYADPGVGKSTAALRAADFGKVVAIDAERGLKARALKRAGVNVGNVEVFTDIEYDRLEQLYFDLKAREEAGNGIFALVIDSITMVIPWLVEHAVAEGVLKAQKLNRKRDSFDVYVEDYGTMTEQLRRLITRRFFDLDCHIIITATPSRDKDENGGVRIGPDITPALGKSLKGAVDMLLFMEAVEMDDGSTQRVARTVPVGVKEAKDRWGVLPAHLVDPGFDRILAYADETLTEETDPLQGATDFSPEVEEPEEEPDADPEEGGEDAEGEERGEE